MIDRRPALIARCAGVADVVAAVRFAREHDLLVSVRGGGHSVAGHAVCDDGLVIDLSPMRGVPSTRRRGPPRPGRRDVGRSRRRDAGVRPGHDRRRRPHTGIAGLTLGGGFGWLKRRTAGGRQPAVGRRRHRRRRLLRASARGARRPLLGAARRRRQLRRRHLVRVPAAPGRPDGPGGRSSTRRAAREVLRFYRELHSASEPDELDDPTTPRLLLCRLGPTARAAGRDRALLRGAPRAGEKLVGAPAHSSAPPAVDTSPAVRRRPAACSTRFPPGRYNYWKSSH